MTLQANDKAPDFTLPATGGKTVSLKKLKGKKVVLYFYPKDDTPGCTQESCDFRDNMKHLSKMGAVVIGASRDDIKSHEKFKAKFDLPFDLVSDENGTLCAGYGVWTEKSMYGKKYMGIERSTFLIDEKGIIRAIWRKVKVGGHVDEVAEAIGNLES